MADKPDDLDQPYKPELIAFTDPLAKRLEFVERDDLTVTTELSVDGHFDIQRDVNGGLIGFTLHGDHTKWAAFRDADPAKGD